MADTVNVDLIVKAISQGFEAVSKDLQNVGSTSQSSGEQVAQSGNAFTELASKVQLAQQAAEIFFGTFQQAFELGRAGAQVIQTSQSFTTLLDVIGAAPDLLDQLRAASQGTIDDMSLMAGVTTLVAGTQGELAQSLANASPQLLEMARAAQKLNPALGDVNYMYESLTLGIKRASPMILDNLGITVRLEEAYASYAATLGKSADQLTSTEQKQALLNAVLAQGDVLINQAGGSASSSVDSFNRMDAAIKNLGDRLKAALAPGLSDAADAVYYLIDGANQLDRAVGNHIGTVGESAKSWEEYSAEIQRTLESVGYFTKEVDGHIQVFKREGQVTREVTSEFGLLSKAAFNVSKDFNDVGVKASEVTAAMQPLAVATDWAAISAQDAGKATEDYAAFLGGFQEDIQAAAEHTAEFAAAQDAASVATAGLAAGLAGEILDAMTEYQETMTELTAEQQALNAELTTGLNAGWSPTSEKVTELNTKLAENAVQQQAAAEALRVATAEMIYQQAAAGLDAEAALELAHAMGLLSEQDYVVASVLQQLKLEFDANRDGAISAAEGADQYVAQVKLINDAVALLQQRNAPITFESLAAAMQEVSSSTADPALQSAPETFDDLEGSIARTSEEAEKMANNSSDAATGIDKIGGAALAAKPDIEQVSGAITDLSDAVAAMPTSYKLKLSSSGGQAVLDLLQDIYDGIAELPAEKKVTITVSADNAADSSGGGGGGGGGGPAPTGPNGGPQVQITNNIYDPLTGALALEQQRMAMRARAERLM